MTLKHILSPFGVSLTTGNMCNQCVQTTNHYYSSQTKSRKTLKFWENIHPKQNVSHGAATQSHGFTYLSNCILTTFYKEYSGCTTRYRTVNIVPLGTMTHSQTQSSTALRMVGNPFNRLTQVAPSWLIFPGDNASNFRYLGH